MGEKLVRNSNEFMRINLLEQVFLTTFAQNGTDMKDENFTLGIGDRTASLPPSGIELFGHAPAGRFILALTDAATGERKTYALPRRSSPLSVIAEVLRETPSPSAFLAEILPETEPPGARRGPKPKPLYAYRAVSKTPDGRRVFAFDRRWDSAEAFVNRRRESGAKALACALYSSCRSYGTAYGYLWRKEYLGETFEENPGDNFRTDPLY